MGDIESQGNGSKEYLGLPKEEQTGENTSQNISVKEKKTENERTTRVEKQDWQLPKLFLFFLGSLLYLEVVFHAGHFGLPDVDFVYSCLFVVSLAGILALLSSWGKRALRITVSYILQVVFCLLYMVQQVYCHVFKTYLTVFSFTTGTGQVLEYWREILLAIAQSSLWLLLYAVPVGALALFWWLERRNNAIRTQEIQPRRQWMWRGILLAFAVALHVGAVAGLPLRGTDYYTPYDLYHYTSAIDITMRKLGVFTTFRLDVKRMIFRVEEPPTDDTDMTWAEDGMSGESWEDAAVSDPTIERTEPSGDEWETATGSGVSGDTCEDVAENGADQAGVNDVEAEEKKQPVGNAEAQGPNTLDIDFEELTENAPNSTVADMHRYFATSGVTQKNEYTGMFEGYNLIMITAEGFSPYAVHEEVTPTLYRLTQEGFIFENFYTPLWGVSTTDGEYVACTGLIPKAGVWSFFRTGTNAMPFGFGNQFGRLGYKCYAYHNHTYDYYERDITHPNMGYEYKGVGNGLVVKETWPESDLEMMEVSIPEYIGEEPFHVYYMTVSGHLNYSFVGNSMSYKNQDVVAELPYSDSARAYIACNVELDRALEKLIAELEAAGIADRTVIALSADHYPYGLEKKAIDELAGHEVEENFEIYRNHFFLWTASMEEPIVVDKVACSMDIAPTLCNLFGLEYDSRLYMGRDILSKESKGLVIFSNRSFITDKAMFNAVTGEVTNLTDEELPADYIQQMNEVVSKKFRYSARIIEQDYYQYILPCLETAPESE